MVIIREQGSWTIFFFSLLALTNPLLLVTEAQPCFFSRPTLFCLANGPPLELVCLGRVHVTDDDLRSGM